MSGLAAIYSGILVVLIVTSATNGVAMLAVLNVVGYLHRNVEACLMGLVHDRLHLSL